MTWKNQPEKLSPHLKAADGGVGGKSSKRKKRRRGKQGAPSYRVRKTAIPRTECGMKSATCPLHFPASDDGGLNSTDALKRKAGVVLEA